MSYLSLKKIKATPLATTFLEYPGFTMELFYDKRRGKIFDLKEFL
jgi:hypothetical protein|tara:strand:- start:333 stop:467 length:135 start_codon:yes stop_codon:yes gene_type:complete